MSPSTIIAILLVLLTCLWSLITTFSKSKHQKLPPGPPSLPIIGNLHMLGNLPHRSLQHLAKKYGHIMFIRLGNVPTIVVSSPKAAELFLKTHDTNFASRPKIQASKYMGYETKGMAFSAYGPYWRHVRKLCTLQLLCPTKIEAFKPLRREELGVLVRKLRKAAEEGGVVDVSKEIGAMNEVLCESGISKKKIITEKLTPGFIVVHSISVIELRPLSEPAKIFHYNQRRITTRAEE